MNAEAKKPPLHLFAVCAPGLENVLLDELKSLSVGNARAIPGGVEFTGNWSTVYRVNLWLRTAGRVLRRLPAFNALTFGELYRKVQQLGWEEFVGGGLALDIQAVSHGSRLYIKKKIAEVIQQAIGDRLQHEVGSAADGLYVLARIAKNVCEISVDTSGELLPRRGYRQETGRAPLRETLAAGMLLLAGYDPARPFCDPMCGAGTIAAEAALLAMRRAPGRGRAFAFQQFPNFDAATWEKLCATADHRALAAPPAPVAANDISESAAAAARANFARAGLADFIALTQRDIGEVKPADEAGLVLFNPPYGDRLARGPKLTGLYARAGAILLDRFAGWNYGVLLERENLFHEMRLPKKATFRLTNGGKKVKLFCGRLD